MWSVRRPDSPFPGASLARFWRQPSQARTDRADIRFAGARRGGPDEPKHRDYWGSPRQLPPLGAIKEKDWSYIRREGDVREELFHLSQDAKEQRNLAGDPTAQTTLRQMRAALDRLTAGPLLPERFSP